MAFREIKTLEVERYSEPDERGVVKLVGMISGREAFDLLKTHLEEVGLMPDGGLIPSSIISNDELPYYSTAYCHTETYGTATFVDINLNCYDDDTGEQYSRGFASGKSLGTSGDDFLRMSRIAAECSLMLNGRGSIVKVTETEFEPKAGLPEREGEPGIDREKLAYFLGAEMITEFESDVECMRHFNVYDYQSFQNVDEMKAYQGEYGFGLDGKWYHIDFDEALDVWVKAPEKEIGAGTAVMLPSSVTELSREQLAGLLSAYDSYIVTAFDARLPETGWTPVCVSEFYENEYRNVWLSGRGFGYMCQDDTCKNVTQIRNASENVSAFETAKAASRDQAAQRESVDTPQRENEANRLIR